jgi:WTAP/Mum2p family
MQMLRLAAKESDLADVQTYAVDVVRAKAPCVNFALHHLTDPAVNVECQLLRSQVLEL